MMSFISAAGAVSEHWPHSVPHEFERGKIETRIKLEDRAVLDRKRMQDLRKKLWT